MGYDIALQGHADDPAKMLRTVILQGSYLERQWVFAQLYVLMVAVLPYPQEAQKEARML